MATQVVMPQLGESVVEGKVSRWLKQEGDAVKQYEPILEVETDKVTTEVTAADGGTLLQILVAEGLVVTGRHAIGRHRPAGRGRTCRGWACACPGRSCRRRAANGACRGRAGPCPGRCRARQPGRRQDRRRA